MICPTAKVKFCPTGCFVAGAGSRALAHRGETDLFADGIQK